MPALHNFGGTLGRVGAIQDTVGNWYAIVDGSNMVCGNTAQAATLFEGSSCSDLTLLSAYEDGTNMPAGQFRTVELSNLRVKSCSAEGFYVEYDIGNLHFDGVGLNIFDDPSCVLWTYQL